MAIQPIQKVMRALTSAESQLTAALVNYETAILAYNVNGIAAQLPPNEGDPVVASDPNSVTRGELVDGITLGATAIFLLNNKGSGANTLIGTLPLDEISASALVAKLGV